MELYYAAINILDWYTKEERNISDEHECYLEDIFYKICEIGDIKIEDIADANDCGSCKSWDELVAAFRELWRTGQRV